MSRKALRRKKKKKLHVTQQKQSRSGSQREYELYSVNRFSVSQSSKC